MAMNLRSTIAIWAAIGSAVTLTGCASSRPDTASGSPEVTIPGVSPDRVKPAIVNVALNHRLRIKTDSPYSIVVEKPTENIAAAILLTSRLGSPAERITFAIAEVPGGTRVVADSHLVTNPGTAYESVNRMTNDPDLQPLLNEVAAATRANSPTKR